MKINKLRGTLRLAAIAVVSLLTVSAHAGPFILAGTDADDHGATAGGANVDGWFFMQRALENLAPGVTNGNKRVVVLGSTGAAAAAINSAFNLSNLSSAGWTLQTVSVADFATFFAAGGGIANAGLLVMDSGSNNVTGGVDGSTFVAHATAIDDFLGAGGGLFSQANGYQWLSALIPGLSAPAEFATGIELTPAGAIAFPGLTVSDLSAGPYHQQFQNYGAIPVLGVSTSSANAIIIGGATGSITDPGRIPEPGSLALVGLALVGGCLSRRRTKR